MIVLVREGRRHDLSPEAFGALVHGGQLRRDDLVSDAEGRLRQAAEFAQLAPHLPAPPSVGGSFLPPVLAVAGIGLAAWGACALIDELTSPTSRAPLSKWKREYVRARDGGVCVYCGRRVTRRTTHIDHYRSRVNGGSDDLRNLRLSCAPCNLAKGALNGGDFRRLLSMSA